MSVATGVEEDRTYTGYRVLAVGHPEGSFEALAIVFAAGQSIHLPRCLIVTIAAVEHLVVNTVALVDYQNAA